MTSSSTSLYVVAAAVCLPLLIGYLQKLQYGQQNLILSPLLESYNPIENCTKIGEGVLSGPEDLALDTIYNLVFVSSHNRGEKSSNGAIYAIGIATDELLPLHTSAEPATSSSVPSFPRQFRPHGIAIAQSCSSDGGAGAGADGDGDGEAAPSVTVTRLFVISHRGAAEATTTGSDSHSIEVFDFRFIPHSHDDDVLNTSTVPTAVPRQQKPLLTHIRTLSHPSLHSPNDLIALNCHEIVISNALPRGRRRGGRLQKMLEGSYDLVFNLFNGNNKPRDASMVHHNLLRNSWDVLTHVHMSSEKLPLSAARGSQRDMEPRRGTGEGVAKASPSSTRTTYSSQQALAAYGNGLITLPHARSSHSSSASSSTSSPTSNSDSDSDSLSLLLRSSSADSTLLQYQASHNPARRVKLTDEQEVSLPLSPDNLEPSPLGPMELLVTGRPPPIHPLLSSPLSLASLSQWLHSLLTLALLRPPPIPSAVLRYNALSQNLSLLYYSSGDEISGSSVAVLSDVLTLPSSRSDSSSSDGSTGDSGGVGGGNNERKLFIGQSFGSFVLSCPVTV